MTLTRITRTIHDATLVSIFTLVNLSLILILAIELANPGFSVLEVF